MKTLTVFTPAYNRAATLARTYSSLRNQTSFDFEWLIIDDGSSDDTAHLVQTWLQEKLFKIRYIYQNNQGMHGAHNTAYRNIDTELNVCIDSDDYMPEDAVEIIVETWSQLAPEHRQRLAGIIGLDVAHNGGLLGTTFQKEYDEITLQDYYCKGGRGDKKIVLRTDLARSFPEYPSFQGEKYVGLGYKYQMIEQQYLWLTINKPLVVVDYQDDGSSRNMYKQWWNNPKGFAFVHNNDLLYTKSLKRRIHVAIDYDAHCIRSHDFSAIVKSNAPLLTCLCVFPGVLLHFYIKNKVLTNEFFSR